MVEETFAEAVEDEGYKTLKKDDGEVKTKEKTEELNLKSSSENGSDRTVVRQDTTPLDINIVTTKELVQEIVEEEKAEEEPEKVQTVVEKDATAEEERGDHVVITKLLTQPIQALPQGGFHQETHSSPLIQTPLPHLFNEQMPTLPSIPSEG